MTKNQIRAEAIQARQSIPRDRLLAQSQTVIRSLTSQNEYAAARAVATYVSKEDEVQTLELIAQMLSEGKRVVVPRVDGPSGNLLFFEIHGLGDLSPGRFGVLEPAPGPSAVPLAECDIVIVPLVAWDERGYRIGYGRGYFDRALARRGASVSVGLAMETQRVPEVPVEPSDVPLDVIVTEKRVLRPHKGGAR